MSLINETHDVQLTSWVDSANSESDFPIQNLPFGVFRRKGTREEFRGGVAIGDQVLDMSAAAKTGVFDEDTLEAAQAAGESALNRLMGMGQPANSALRLALSRLLRSGSLAQSALQGCLVAQPDIEFDLPCRVGDYTDFYSSINHATAVGRLFRPDQPLMPNYKWVPIAYHGRSSTIGVSGKDFHRPVGQSKPIDGGMPIFGPSKRLDYELELGIFIGEGSDQGDPIDIAHAEKHIFGVCLFNDWSARDIQAWEYQPLGPFLGKNFASTISPWIVTIEALAPFRLAFSRENGDPQPLDYLTSDSNTKEGAIDIRMEVFLQTEKMRQDGQQASKVSGTSFKHCYWTAAQMVAHHTVNGCGMNSGDLLGSGTQSGPNPEEAGSLLELSVGGKEAFRLPNGESRSFLEDGDTVVMSAYCEKPGAISIGFGEARAQILPAKN